MATNAKKAYDVVVIGAGNGGLVAAIRVLQAGFSCLVLEKHNLPGGFATSFKRGRFEFEASLHELNDFGSPRRARRRAHACSGSLGVERQESTGFGFPRPTTCFTTDKKYDCVMPFGLQAFIDKMVEYCPGIPGVHYRVFRPVQRGAGCPDLLQLGERQHRLRLHERAHSPTL